MFCCVGVYTCGSGISQALVSSASWAAKANPYPENVSIPVKKNHCSHLDPKAPV